ncbi:MAG: hypothetical protein IT343_16470 [Candidatus Melainabacteria bacterium]|nr:hypothetical protein [Candidatus Melainabacteria bacterium]
MAEPNSALASDMVAKEHQPVQSNNSIFSEFAGGVWDGAVTKKVQSVSQLFGSDTKPQEVKRSTAQQIAHTAGEVTGDLIDFVILAKVGGRAFSKFAPEIAATGKVGEYVALNPIGRSMAVGGSVGLVHGSLLTPLKEGENNWNRLGNGVTEMATFATLGGVATKLQPMAEAGMMGRIKMNAASGAAAGVVNSQLEGWTHGRQAGLGETALNTAGWMVGNVAFGEAFHGFGKLGKQFFPNLNMGETSLASNLAMKPEEAAAIRQNLAAMKAEAAAMRGQTSGPIDATRGTSELRPTKFSLAPETAPPAGKSHGERAAQTAERPPQERVVEPVEGEVAAGQRAAAEKAAAEKAGETVAPTDGRREKIIGRVMLDKKESVSMRELYQKDEAAAEKLLEAYYAKLEKAFPLEGEIEEMAVYRDYLKNQKGTWDMVVLRDKEQNVMGGIQFQIVDVGGKTINKAAWGEHIWLDNEAKNGRNFFSLVGIARDRIEKAGGDVVFMEFNNPDKMSIEELLADKAAGISAQDREKIWGGTGIHVAVDSKGRIAEYGQPSMGEGLPPVRFLSLGFISTKPLTGKQMPVEDYLSLLHKAHSTIPSVKLETDPTVKWYEEAIAATGDKYFTYVPLNALGVAREAGMRAAQEEMQKATGRAMVKALENGQMKDVLTKLFAESNGNPQNFQAALDAVLAEMALKAARGRQ